MCVLEIQSLSFQISTIKVKPFCSNTLNYVIFNALFVSSSNIMHLTIFALLLNVGQN